MEGHNEKTMKKEIMNGWNQSNAATRKIRETGIPRASNPFPTFHSIAAECFPQPHSRAAPGSASLLQIYLFTTATSSPPSTLISLSLSRSLSKPKSTHHCPLHKRFLTHHETEENENYSQPCQSHLRITHLSLTSPDQNLKTLKTLATSPRQHPSMSATSQSKLHVLPRSPAVTLPHNWPHSR